MKTRNQRKQERMATALLTGVLVVLMVIACSLFVRAWNSPAENHIDGTIYMEQVGGVNA